MSDAALRERRFGGGGLRLDDVGETRLLTALVASVGNETGDAVVVQSGDDAAVWRPPIDRELVLTQDALVEGEDFRYDWIRPHRLGRRSLAVSLSDLAAMGAVPAFALITLCAPPSLELEAALAIQAGIAELAAEHEMALLGGDVSRIEGPMVLDLVVGGTVIPGRALRRDRGCPGDVLLVTGVLGRAAAGLRLLLDGRREETATDVHECDWIAAQLEPVARLDEGTALVEAGARCAGDLSDGLIADVTRTARASGCAAELWLDAIPVAPALPERFPEQWRQLALGAGEDFELLVAAPVSIAAAVIHGWSPRLAPLRQVGRLVSGELGAVTLLERQDGVSMSLPTVSSGHFG